ncbi:hypothetical protein BX666DRAFT_1940425 [Dichotomocladium elegans]|nr:hypothetical protein BX666DRAFT_1940425 [Dichotomocladium elegans]
MLRRNRGQPDLYKLRGPWLLISYLILAFMFAAPVARAEYNVSQQDLTKLRHLQEPIYFTRHNQLHIIGGWGQNDFEYEEAVVSIDSEVIINNARTTLSEPPVPLKNFSTVLPVYSDQEDILYLFVGDYAETSAAMTVLHYTFHDSVWHHTPLLFSSGTPNSDFRLRIKSTATIGVDGAIYLYGGYIISNDGDQQTLHVSMDVYKYFPTNGSIVVYRPTSDQPLPALMSHTATCLGDGSILYLGGLNQAGNNAVYTPANLYPYEPLDNAYRFYPETGKIETINLRLAEDQSSTRIISWRMGAMATLSTDKNKVYFFGGISQNVNEQKPDYFLIFNDFWELDIRTWEWRLPELKGDPPFARYSGASALLTAKSDQNEEYIIYMHGANENAALADINVLSLNKMEWLHNITLGPAQDVKKNSVLYFFSIPWQGTVIFWIACVVGAVLLAFMIFHFRIWLFDLLAQELRRSGPTALGIAHLLSRVFLTTVLCLYIYYVFDEAINSVQIGQEKYREGEKIVNVPDIRFCFDGWFNPEVRFKTDTLDMSNCTRLGFIHKLDMSVHQPYFASGTGLVECFLFSPAPWFRLQQSIPGQMMNPQAAGNGSHIIFDFYNEGMLVDSDGKPRSGLVNIEIYPLDRNPNFNIYNIGKEQVIAADSKNASIQQSELIEWLAKEKYDFPKENAYWSEPGVSSVAYYTLQHYKALDHHPWNYVGVFTFIPEKFSIVLVEEQKLHTLMAAIGSIFGIAGFLMTHLDSFLFGQKPQNPWGVVQRIFVTDKMKQRMAEYFMTSDDDVPFVEPVKEPRSESERKNFKDKGLKFEPLESEPTDSSREKAKGNDFLSLPKADDPPSLVPLPNKALAPSETQQQEPLMKKIAALEATLEKMQIRMQYTELVLRAHYIDPVVFNALFEGGRAKTLGLEENPSLRNNLNEMRKHLIRRWKERKNGRSAMANEESKSSLSSQEEALYDTPMPQASRSISDETIQIYPTQGIKQPHLSDIPTTLYSPEPSSSPNQQQQVQFDTPDQYQPAMSTRYPLGDGHQAPMSQDQTDGYFPPDSPRPTHRLE